MGKDEDPLKGLIEDAAGNILSEGDTVIEFRNKPKPIITSGQITLLRKKPCIVEPITTDLTTIGKSRLLFRIKNNFEECLLTSILNLLNEMNEEMAKERPNLSKFADKIDEIVNRPDWPFPNNEEEDEEDE